MVKRYNILEKVNSVLINLSQINDMINFFFFFLKIQPDLVLRNNLSLGALICNDICTLVSFSFFVWKKS